MWFGILTITEAERDDGQPGDLAIVHVYQRDRLFTIAGDLEAVPEILTVMRLAAYDSALAPPRCRSCGHGLDVPDLDGLEAACSSS